MGRLQTWGAAARRSRLFQVVAVVVVLALVAGSIVLVTRSAGPPTVPPAPAPPTSTRAVALGDSVPYGHGLANPYLTSQIGLPADAVSQGPSRQAYPTLVAADLGLTMTVRPTNCHLTGDQLSISGAVADGVDNTTTGRPVSRSAAAGPEPVRRVGRGRPGPAPGPPRAPAGRSGRHRLQRLPRVPARPRSRRGHRAREHLRRQRRRHARRSRRSWRVSGAA